MDNSDYSGLDALSIVTNMNTVTSNLGSSMGYTDEHESIQKRKQSKVSDSKQETTSSKEGVSLNEATNQDKPVFETESTSTPKFSHASRALQKVLGGHSNG